MKFFLKYFFLITIIFLCSLIWPLIKIPYINGQNSVGILTVNGYNPFNDTLRYLIFLSLPLIFYAFFEFKFNKNKLINYRYFFEESPPREDNLNFITVLPIFSILVFFSFLEFLSTDPSSTKFLDPLHHGDFLTPALNYIITKDFWISSFTVHGGSNIFYPVLAWKIFNLETVGSFTTFMLFLIFILKISSIFFAFNIAKFSSLDTKYKLILFTLLSLIILSISSYQDSEYLNIRDLYALIFFIFFSQCFYKKEKLIPNLFISFIPILAIIMHVDIGIYLCVILFFYLFFLILSKKLKDFFQIIIFFISTISLFILIFGLGEFYAFFNHTKHIVANIDKIHGLEYPQPLFSIGEHPDGSRATKNIIFQLIMLILIFSFTFSKRDNLNRNEKLFFIFFGIYAFMAFKNALGRSDSMHLMASSDWQTIILGFFLLLIILNFMKLSFLSKLSQKNIYFISILIVIIFSFSKVNHKNILNFKTKFKETIITNDSNYISEERRKSVSLLKQEFQNEKCLQNFTEDLVILYLIKKPSCTKYFSSWLASGFKMEKKYIDELVKKKVNYVLFKSPGFVKLDNISSHERLKYVNTFLNENYSEILNISGYIVIKRKN